MPDFSRLQQQIQFLTEIGLIVVGSLLGASGPLAASAFAATPVDLYHNMESGANGDLLTSALMNASSHGRATWSIGRGEMWVSTDKARDLPGPVIVGETNYAGKATTRSWMFHDDNSLNYVECTLPGVCPKITVACFYTPGVTIRFANQFDTICMTGNQGFSVLQTRNDDGKGPYFRAHSCTAGWRTTFSPKQIKIVPGKTYWVNLHFDADQGKTSVAAFDPDKAFALVGDVVVADSWLHSTGIRQIGFGRADNHGPNPTAKTQSYFGQILIDYSHGVFPLVPAAAVGARSEFRPGEVWLDTDGKPIQAHSGGILLRDGTYYWYGEDKTLGDRNRTGIACYSSKDMHRWRREGLALPKEAMPPQFRDEGIVERPKVLYNAKTRKYVMWMHLDDPSYCVASAGIATSDQPTGPFAFRKQMRPIHDDFNYKAGSPDRQKEMGGTLRDMNLFLDDDGAAYVFYASEGNNTMYVVRLDDEFLGPQTPTVQGKTWARIFVGQTREAPAPFKCNGRYFVITSGCSGWAPNAASYAVAQNILGPWQTKGNPCVGQGANTTFRAQSTFVLPVPNKPNRFIFLADRWNERKLQDSRYVWLPLKVQDDGTLTLTWHDKWDMSVFDEK